MNDEIVILSIKTIDDESQFPKTPSSLETV